METLRWKIRISFLWVFMAVAMSAHIALYIFEPGAIEKIIKGEWNLDEGMFVVLSFFWLVPLTMAVLSVSLKDLINRWTNIIVGVAAIAFSIAHFALCPLKEPSIHQFIIVGSSIIVAALILFHALKWPKEKAGRK